MKNKHNYCGDGPTEDIVYPRHSDKAGFYVLSVMIDNPSGGWMWETIKIKTDHIYKISW